MNRSFNLELSVGDQPMVFPVPQTNQYQTITQVVCKPDANIVKVNELTEVAVFTKPGKASLSFSFTSQSIKRTLRDINISQRKSSPYFYSDSFIDKQDKHMQALAAQWIAEANAKTANEMTLALYNGTLAYLTYGNPTKYLHSYSNALETIKTDCGGFSTFLATLLQTQNIPCRMVVGNLFLRGLRRQFTKWLNGTMTFADLTMHAWLEVETESGEWFPIDASVDWRYRHHQSPRQAGFGFIPDDRLVLSVGHNLVVPFQGQHHTFPILQHPESLHD